MQTREPPLDRAYDGEVVVARERRVDAALQADLGRAAFPRLAQRAHDLVVRDEVRRAAQVRRELALREGAEAAAEVADVRVLDVARDDVGDLVAVDLAAQPVGGGEDTLAFLAARAEEARQLVLPELVARVSTGSASRGHDGTATSSPGRPAVLAGEPQRVARRGSAAGAHPVEPLAQSIRDRPASRGASSSPLLAVAAARRSSSGHGASGLTWSIVTGETPPQSSMPASSSAGKSS